MASGAIKDHHDHTPAKRQKRMKERIGDDQWINKISNAIGQEWFTIGNQLGYEDSQLEKARMVYPFEPDKMIFKILRKWWDVAVKIIDDKSTAKVMANCISELNIRCASLIARNYEDSELSSELQRAVRGISFDQQTGRRDKELTIFPENNYKIEQLLANGCAALIGNTSEVVTVPSASSAPPEPYVVVPLNNYIKKCAGCRSKFKKPIKAPDDFVFKHRERDEFFDKKNDSMRRVFNNKHYHIASNCVLSKNPNFVPSSICVPPNVSLTDEHFEFFKERRVDLRKAINRKI